MKFIFSYILMFFWCFVAFGQEEYVISDSIQFELSDKECTNYNKRLIKKCDKLSARVKKSTDYALQKFMVQEDALLNKMCGINERQAETLLNNSLYSYRRFEEMQKRKSDESLSVYIPELDSISISLMYLESTGKGCDANSVKESLRNLKAELKRSELVGIYIKERNIYLHKVVKENPVLHGMMIPLEKTEYYFNSQIGEYFKLFQMRSQPENAIMTLLGKVPGFQDFANLNGALAQVNTSSARIGGQSMQAALTQMQEAAKAEGKEVADLLNPENLFGNASPLEQENTIRNNLNEVADQLKGQSPVLNEEIQELKKLDEISSNNDSIEEMKKKGMRDKSEWTPNPLKSKRFIDRLSFSANLQASQKTKLFPTTGVISAELSYQLTTKMNFGVGLSSIAGFYKIRNDEKNGSKLRLANNGYNIRSFYNFEIRKNIYFQLNYEWNDQRSMQEESPRPFFHLKTNEASASMLAGLKVKTPSTKRTEKTLELLYNFTHERTSQPAFVVRMGINLTPKNYCKY